MILERWTDGTHRTLGPRNEGVGRCPVHEPNPRKSLFRPQSDSIEGNLESTAQSSSKSLVYDSVSKSTSTKRLFDERPLFPTALVASLLQNETKHNDIPL